MAKRLTTILLSTFILSIIISTILTTLVIDQQPNDIAMMNCDMSGIAYALCWMVIICVAIGTTTLYLNLYKKIRNDYFYSLLSFLLFPLVIGLSFTALFGDYAHEWKGYAAIILPYTGILLYHFIKFRKYIKHISTT